jgi:hypothetical protein
MSVVWGGMIVIGFDIVLSQSAICQGRVDVPFFTPFSVQ